MTLTHILQFRSVVLSDILRSKSKEENGNTIDIEDLEECLKALGFSPDDEDVEFLKKHLDDNSKCWVFVTTPQRVSVTVYDISRLFDENINVIFEREDTWKGSVSPKTYLFQIAFPP